MTSAATWRASPVAFVAQLCTQRRLIFHDAADERSERDAAGRLRARLTVVGGIGCTALRRIGLRHRRDALVFDQPEVQQHVEQHVRLHVLRQHAESAESSCLTDVHLAFLGGVHHHRNHRGARIALDGGERLQPVHPRHDVVHEDHVDAVMLEELECLFAGRGELHDEFVLFQLTS